MNHFASVCRKKDTAHVSPLVQSLRVSAVDTPTAGHDAVPCRQIIMFEKEYKQQTVVCKLDSGAECNVLPLSRGEARHFRLEGHWRGQFCNKGSCQWSV